MNFVSTLERTSFQPSYRQKQGARDRKAAPQGQNNQGFRFSGEQQSSAWQAGDAYNISCKWETFRREIMQQWSKLSAMELDSIGPNRSKLALLIENKYGIPSHLVENYLRNFERTLPLI